MSPLGTWLLASAPGFLGPGLLPAGVAVPFHPGPHDGPVLHLLSLHVPMGALVLLAAAVVGLLFRFKLRNQEPGPGR